MAVLEEKVKKPRTEKQIEAIDKLNLARKKAKEMIMQTPNMYPRKT